MTQFNNPRPANSSFEKALAALTEKLAMEVLAIFIDQHSSLKLYNYEIEFLDNYLDDGEQIILAFRILEGIVEFYYEEFKATFTSHQIDMEVETYDTCDFFYAWFSIFPLLEKKAQSFEESFCDIVASYRDATEWDKILLKDRVEIFTRLEAVSRNYKREFLKTFENYQMKKFED